MTARSSAILSTFGKLPCAQCGTSLVAPVWSEHIDELKVRHLWNCDDCGYLFETLVCFSVQPHAEMSAPLAA
jgi:hypothetical protein